MKWKEEKKKKKKRESADLVKGKMESLRKDQQYNKLTNDGVLCFATSCSQMIHRQSSRGGEYVNTGSSSIRFLLKRDIEFTTTTTRSQTTTEIRKSEG
jgi:hypothetical protein